MRSLNTILLLLFSLVLISGCSHNVRTGDISKLDRNQLYYFESLGVKTDNFNAPYVDQLIKEVWLQASVYPTKFDSEMDKKIATRNILFLSEELERLTAENYMDANYLWRAATVNHMGHNLDILGAHERADEAYKKFIEKRPYSALGYFSYGNFLAGSLYHKQSIPIFEKALKLGAKGAHRSLTLVYLQMGDIAKAKEHVEIYNKYFPDDKFMQLITKALRSNNLIIQQVQH